MKKINFRVFKKGVSVIDRIHFFISFFIRATLLIACFIAIYTQNWIVLFVSLGTFVLTFVTAFFESRYKIDLPSEIELIIVIFIYSAIYLGEVHKYYTIFWWWDVILHTGSGIVLGFIGFIILFILYKGRKISASPFTIVFFAFCFAVAMGTIWEIFEFAVDEIGKISYMQERSLRDTMWDLIVDSFGALLTSIIGYIYLKTGKFFVFDKVMARFVRDNPEIFSPKLLKKELVKELRQFNIRRELRKFK